MNITDVLDFVNLLLIPLLFYVVKVEIRLTKIEVMQSAEYKFLVERNRGQGYDKTGQHQQIPG